MWLGKLTIGVDWDIDNQNNNSTVFFLKLKNMSLCPLYGLIYPYIIFSLFVCFVALRPKSTAMVMVGRSVHITTLFPGQASTSS